MSRSAWLAAVVCLVPALVAGQGLTDAFGGNDPAPAPQRLPVEGGGNSAITGALDGTTVTQPVADPAADVQTLVLMQSDEAMIDVPFRFLVRVVGDPARAAGNTRVRIAVKLVRADGSQAPAGEVSFTRAVMPERLDRPRRDCTVAGNDRVCTFGDLPPAGEAVVSGEVRSTAAARPGSLMVTVLTRIGDTERTPVEATVTLAARRELSNVGLTVALSSDADVGVMGHDFVHAVTVTNSSAREAATRTTLEIRQRAVANADGRLAPLAADGMEVSVGDQRCVPQNRIYRCLLGTLKAGESVRVPVQVKILKDLPAQRSGRIETQARIKSAEIDPELEDNFAKTLTTLVSRQPQIAFLSPVKGANGQTRFVERDNVADGELFAIGARFMHSFAEPDAQEVIVRLVVNGALPVDVPLRRPLVGSGPIYRSAPLRLLQPGARAADAAETAIRARNGDELSAHYQRSSATARAVGTR